ncbi:DUF1559 family PulG-like putative transporter [Lacunimicrobium album]
MNLKLVLLVFSLLLPTHAFSEDALPEAKLLPSKTIALGTAKPAKILAYKPLRDFIETSLLFDSQDIQSPFTFHDFTKVDRITIAIDQPLINKMAASDGFTVRQLKTRAIPEVNSLRQISKAMLEYCEQFDRFPRYNGDAGGRSTGLSWRVHLLPFLGELELFKKFRFNEPWDSEHNKALIPLMPKVYAVEGITEPGKTSIHVITGLNTVFPHNARIGTARSEITDGLSSTFFAVIADISTATEWTRPVGIEYDSLTPMECLGKKSPNGNWVLLCDGGIRRLSPRAQNSEFAAYVTINDAKVLETVPFQHDVQAPLNLPLPTMILSFNEPFDLKKLAPHTTDKQSFSEFTLYNCNGVGVLPTTSESPTTFIIADTVDLQNRLRAGAMFTSKPDALLEHLDATADVSYVINFQSQRSLVKQYVDRSPEFMTLLDYEQLSHHVWFTERKPGDLIMKATATFATPRMAITKADEVTVQSKQLQSLVPTLIGEKVSESTRQLIIDLATIKVERAGDKVITSIAAPAGIEELHDQLTPIFAQAAKTVEQTRISDNLRMICKAMNEFHNKHDRYPSTTSGVDKAIKGLSWRVHILPYLGEQELYDKFHLNESWDSPHNLTLTERMPSVFKSPGITVSNKTCIHILTGDGTPFDNGKFPRLTDFKDSLAKTMIIAVGAPEKAEVWTKPGGLELDMRKPVRSLGDFDEKPTLGITADGTIKEITFNYRAVDMRNLVRNKQED